MRRRRLLATCTAVAVSLAGCVSMGGPATGSEETPNDGAERTPTGRTAKPTERRRTDDGNEAGGPYAVGETATVPGLGDVTVESVAVQRSVVHHHLWRDLYEPDGEQMLIVETDYGGEEELSFVAGLDGEAVDSTERVPLTPNGGRFALSVPVGSVERAVVRLDAGGRPAWELPAETRARLAAAPEFHLHDATVTGSGGRTVLELGVENRGDRDGTFRGIVVSAVAADADAAVRFPVRAGETVAETVRNSVVADWNPDDEFEHHVEPDTRRFAVNYA